MRNKGWEMGGFVGITYSHQGNKRRSCRRQHKSPYQGDIHAVRLCFAGIRELLSGDDQPDSLVLLDQLVLALSLLLDVSKKSLDSSVSLEGWMMMQRIGGNSV